MLQGHFSGEEAKGLIYEEACFKVIRASVLIDDGELLTPTDDGDVQVQSFKTLFKGQGIVMVWSDQVAYENRAVPVTAFYVNFDTDPNVTSKSLLEQAYDNAKLFLQETFPDHEYSNV